MVDAEAEQLLSQEASGVQDWLFLSSSQMDDLENSPDGYEFLEPKPTNLPHSATMDAGLFVSAIKAPLIKEFPLCTCVYGERPP